MSKFEQVRRTVDVIASAVTIVAGAALSYVIFVQPTAPNKPAFERPPLEAGTPIKRPQESGAAATAIVFIQSQCNYCTESMPFYRQLVQAVNEQAPDLRLLFVSSENAPTSRAYLEAHDIQIRDSVRVSEVEMQDYPMVYGTPTLLVVDSTGQLVRGWRGMVDDVGQREIFATLRLGTMPANDRILEGSSQ